MRPPPGRGPTEGIWVRIRAGKGHRGEPDIAKYFVHSSKRKSFSLPLLLSALIPWTDPCTLCWQKGRTCDRDPDDLDGKCAWCIRTSQACTPSPFPRMEILEEDVRDCLKSADASVDTVTGLSKRLAASEVQVQELKGECATLRGQYTKAVNAIGIISEKLGLGITFE